MHWVGVARPKYIIFWLHFASTKFFPYIFKIFPHLFIKCGVGFQPSQKKFKRNENLKPKDHKLETRKIKKNIRVSVEFMIPRDLRWVGEFALGRGRAP